MIPGQDIANGVPNKGWKVLAGDQSLGEGAGIEILCGRWEWDRQIASYGS